MDINFVWSREDSAEARATQNADFICSPVNGVIESGKKTSVKFDYISENLELTESFWRFFIQEHNTSVPFLLVGHTTEPTVSLDRSHLNFREILIGNSAFLFPQHLALVPSFLFVCIFVITFCLFINIFNSNLSINYYVFLLYACLCLLVYSPFFLVCFQFFLFFFPPRLSC